MGSIRFTQPRANPPICFFCDKKLHAGGRSYEKVREPDGLIRTYHISCAKAYRAGLSGDALESSYARPRPGHGGSKVLQLNVCMFCEDAIGPAKEPSNTRSRWVCKRYCDEVCYLNHLDQRHTTGEALPEAENLGRGNKLKTELLPEREGITHKFEIAGAKCYVIINQDTGGKVREIFLVIGRSGEDDRAKAEEWGKNVSSLLQYGEPLDEIARQARGTRWGPSGFMTKGHPEIKSCSGPVDYVGQLLQKRYLDVAAPA